MKKNGALLVVLFLLVSCAACAEEDAVFEFSAGSAATVESAQNAAEETQPESGVAWTFPISREILDDPDGVLILVNKDNLLDKRYPAQSTLVPATVLQASS